MPRLRSLPTTAPRKQRRTAPITTTHSTRIDRPQTFISGTHCPTVDQRESSPGHTLNAHSHLDIASATMTPRQVQQRIHPGPGTPPCNPTIPQTAPPNLTTITSVIHPSAQGPQHPSTAPFRIPCPLPHTPNPNPRLKKRRHPPRSNKQNETPTRPTPAERPRGPKRPPPAPTPGKS